MTGTFDNARGAALAGGLTPLAIVGGIIVTNVINQLEPPPGIQHYFHLRGNLENGFNPEDLDDIANPSVRQTIDGYELSRTSAIPNGQEKWTWYLQDKRYLQLKNGALGIYHEKRKEGRRLLLLKYAKNDNAY